MNTIEEEESLSLDESSLTHVSILGRGRFGYVSLKRDSNSKLYAKKSSPFTYMKILKKELRIMRHFRNHPHIVQASSYILHLKTKPEVCSIYMEFASKGTLHNLISSFHGGSMPENMIGLAASMILQGLNAFHSNGYVHCDLKSTNILVFPSTTLGEPWNLKLADFGLSKEPFTGSRSLSGGTEQYMPPESLGPNGVIGKAVDIWSLGCMVIEMFGGYPEKMKDCYMWRLPKHVSPLVNDFLIQCLSFEPSRRATATELLNHPFVAQRVCVPRRVMQYYSSFLRFPSFVMESVVEEIYRKSRGEIESMIPQFSRSAGFSHGDYLGFM